MVVAIASVTILPGGYLAALTWINEHERSRRHTRSSGIPGADAHRLLGWLAGAVRPSDTAIGTLMRRWSTATSTRTMRITSMRMPMAHRTRTGTRIGIDMNPWRTNMSTFRTSTISTPILTEPGQAEASPWADETEECSSARPGSGCRWTGSAISGMRRWSTRRLRGFRCASRETCSLLEGAKREA